jgi:hypothetical protein
MSRTVSKSRAIAIASPNLSREQLAAARKRERKAEESRQANLARQDEAVPTARKVGAEYKGGDDPFYRPFAFRGERNGNGDPVMSQRVPPTHCKGSRSGHANGDGANIIEGARAVMVYPWERIAEKAAIPREMVEAIGMQLGGCNLREIAETLTEKTGREITRSMVKGYLERGKAKMRGVYVEETEA